MNKLQLLNDQFESKYSISIPLLVWISLKVLCFLF
jgi:hypothetical protein